MLATVPQTTYSARMNPLRIHPADAFPLINNRTVVLVDVREEEEYAFLRVPGSRNIPLSRLHALHDSLREYDHVFIICARGGRSEQAMQFLHAQGHTHISDIAGGIMDWQEQGLPTESYS